MTSILTVNIGAAAPLRAARILDWLKARREDVFVLTETSPGLGTKLILDHFREQGYVVAQNDFTGKERGVAIVSKLESSSDTSEQFLNLSIPERVAALCFKEHGSSFCVVGLYIPSRDRRTEKIAKKQLFIESLLEAMNGLPQKALRNMVVCGDYNVIGRTHVPRYSKFLAFEYDFLEALQERDFTDAFAYTNPGVQAYSWVGRTGDGYRYDYFHVGASLLERVTASNFHHDTRAIDGFTDHSALTLELS